MSKQQYIRLTLVLAVPVLIFSFWLAQQDFVFNRGQFVQCDINENTCDHIQIPLSALHEINSNNLLLKYGATSSENFLGLYNFSFPVKVFAPHISEDREVDISSLINNRALEEKLCTLHQGLSFSCNKDLLSFTSNHGRIEFVNQNDAIKFNNIITKGRSFFQDYLVIQIAIGLGFFLFFSFLYLIASWLLHFVIHGAERKSEKKKTGH